MIHLYKHLNSRSFLIVLEPVSFFLISCSTAGIKRIWFRVWTDVCLLFHLSYLRIFEVVLLFSTDPCLGDSIIKLKNKNHCQSKLNIARCFFWVPMHLLNSFCNAWSIVYKFGSLKYDMLICETNRNWHILVK